MSVGKFLAPVGFRFTTEMLPNLTNWIQRVHVPSLSITATKSDNPFVPINVAGDAMQYEDLIIAFKIDEELTNYSSIVRWMEALAFPESHESYRLWMAEHGATKGTGMLTILNAKYNQVGKIMYEDISPIRLSGFEMRTDVDGIDYLEVTTTFSYTKSVLTVGK